MEGCGGLSYLTPLTFHPPFCKKGGVSPVFLLLPSSSFHFYFRKRDRWGAQQRLSMFVLGNLAQALATLLSQVLKIYNIVIIVAVLISWVRPDPFNPIVRGLRAVTEPLFDWVRRHVPFALIGMLDLSPILVLLSISFLQVFLVSSLYDLARLLR